MKRLPMIIGIILLVAGLVFAGIQLLVGAPTLLIILLPGVGVLIIINEVRKRKPSESISIKRANSFWWTTTSSEKDKMKVSPIMIIGIILLVAGVVLSGIQLFLKEDISVWGISTGSKADQLPITYLFVGLAVAIIGVLLIVADLMRKSFQQKVVSGGTVETPTSEVNISEQIEQLAKLKEQGIVSDAEFEEKKKELLTRM